MTTIIEVQTALQNLTNKRISFTDIGKAIGTGRSNISLRAKSDSQLTDKELKLIEKAFEVNLNDILQSDEGFYPVPVRGEVYASMGSGITIDNEKQTGVYQISTGLAREIGVNLKYADMIFASGDSMLPTIEGGDSILVDKSKTDIYDGRIYCVRIEGQLYAKRLQKIPPYKIKVISDNKEKYDPFYIDLSKDLDFDFAVVGEIRWWGRVAR